MKMNKPEYITGTYAVGTETFSIFDETRTEQLGPATGPRKIAVRLYYPVNKQDVEGLPKEAALSQFKREALEKAFHVKMPKGADFTADYYADVPQVAGMRFPLILFNHGYNSYVEGHTFLCCELASNGYIVASVGHAHEAIANEYEDGSTDLFDKKINKMMYDNSILKVLIDQSKLKKAKGTPEEIYEKFNAFQKKHMNYIIGRVPVWAEDTLCAVRALKERCADRIDFSKGIGATGHSMGGAVAYYLCQHEEEFSCGLNIDGGLFGDYEGMIMKKPFLQICCEDNRNVTTRPLFGTEAFVRREVFEDMKHLGFADAKFMIPIKAAVGKLDGVTMHKRLVACHFEIFDRYLRGQESACGK
ncbi:MAG: hypothetical protein IKY23_02225 [Lachnospiraceae bacterium]|nr:hypothetical protein [Lachnospiraceae bacterium]